MKKMITLLALLAVCLGCFAGCGENSEKDTAKPMESAKPAPTEAASDNGEKQESPAASADGGELALTIDGTNYSVAECNIYFVTTYYEFLNTYGDYASLLGLDTSTGMSGLKEQSCEYSEDGTWYGYFLSSAKMMMTQIRVLDKYAAENDIQISEEQRSDIEQLFADLDSITVSYGYESGDAYLTSVYGSGVTKELYRKYLEDSALADTAYQFYVGSLSFTEQELDDHYAQMGYEDEDNAYPVTAMRHLLVMAEADENGEYTEEAIAAAHRQAQALYESWLGGEQTEESFAALAAEHTDDSGSASSGGLYEDIFKGQTVPGINEWLFTPGRAVGDTAVVDNNEGYVGTHILYFVGQGELYSRVLARDDLMETTVSDWFTALTDSCTPEPGAGYESIGEF